MECVKCILYLVLQKNSIFKKVTMENKYEIFCLVNGDQHKTYVYLYEEKENYQIKFELDDIIIWSKGKNYFDALINLRKKLEADNIMLLCKGCSRYVYPSPMILSMGDAIKAYELSIGKHAHTNDLVNIFEPCRYDEYASIEEQYNFYEMWSKSRKS